MKTDSDLLFEFTEDEIKENYEKLELTWDLYNELPENLDAVTKAPRLSGPGARTARSKEPDFDEKTTGRRKR